MNGLKLWQSSHGLDPSIEATISLVSKRLTIDLENHGCKILYGGESGNATGSCGIAARNLTRMMGTSEFKHRCYEGGYVGIWLNGFAAD